MTHISYWHRAEVAVDAECTSWTFKILADCKLLEQLATASPATSIILLQDAGHTSLHKSMPLTSQSPFQSQWHTEQPLQQKSAALPH